jgi:hypothetical protein
MYYRLFFGGLRALPKRRLAALDDADRLRFIYAIRWSLIPPFESTRWWQRKPRTEQRWHLYFESNFDGEWDEYLDNFGAVLSTGLTAILRPAMGFAGFGSIALFKAYARQYDYFPSHYYVAYPELTATDIRVHLAVTHRDQSSSGSPATRAGAPTADTPSRAQLKARQFGLNEPSWLTLCAPLRTQSASATRQLLASFADATSPFQCDDVHFARATTIKQSTRTWLLVSLTYDRPSNARNSSAAGIIEVLLSDEQRRGRLATLIDCCALGLSGPASDFDADHLAELLGRYVVDSTLPMLAYCAYPAVSVAQVRHAVTDTTRLSVTIPAQSRV